MVPRLALVLHCTNNMQINARFASVCPVCQDRIQVGTLVEWSRGNKAKHVTCTAVAEGPIRLWSGNGEGWTVGQVILSDEKTRRSGGPDGIVIVTASREYIREDGMSFGLDDDSGYLHTATARPATRKELTPAIKAAHTDAILLDRRRGLRLLIAWFREVGIYTPGKQTLEGEEIGVEGRGDRLYGGGHWFVVEPATTTRSRAIWYVRNNGRDGDDWSVNNIITGGAGGIGRWVRWSTEIEAAVRRTTGSPILGMAGK